MGIRTDDVIILDVDDMIARLQQSDFELRVCGIILVLICMISSLVFLIFGIYRIKNRRYSALGRLMIKKDYLGNQIEVYNNATTLALVINGEVVDEFEGIVAINSELMGKIITADGEKNIRLKLTSWGTLSLYCEEVRIGKKRAPFG